MPQQADPMVLCLDFDGVIHSYKSGWKGARNIPDPPVQGAMHALRYYVAQRFKVVIHTSRFRYWGGKRAVKRWIRRMLNLQFDAMTADDTYSGLTFSKGKPPAHLTLDDRAMTFDGGWPTAEEIRGFKTWREQGICGPQRVGGPIPPWMRGVSSKG